MLIISKGCEFINNIKEQKNAKKNNKNVIG